MSRLNRQRHCGLRKFGVSSFTSTVSRIAAPDYFQEPSDSCWITSKRKLSKAKTCSRDRVL
jgi:hypothetical protein